MATTTTFDTEAVRPARLAGILAAGGVFIACWLWLIPQREAPLYAPLPLVSADNETARYAEHWVTQNETNESHSANIIINQGKPVATWYGGTEEGHRDVAIFMSVFDGEWGPPIRIIDRAKSELALNRYIRKVGNPALHSWPDGSLGLYFVTVSFGGWAASAINYMESSDLGQTWSQPERLVTSPFLNISTLVRTNGLPLTDGSIELPVYHESMGKFSEALRIDRSQRVLSKIRMSRGKHSLQPTMVPFDDYHALALMRYAGSGPPRALATSTYDAGQHWTPPIETTLPNPNSALVMLKLRENEFLLALNDTEDERDRLSLALGNGTDWQIMRVVEQETSVPGSHEFEFSYPSLALDQDENIHLVYTWNQIRIKHLVFNRQWVLEGTPGAQYQHDKPPPPEH